MSSVARRDVWFIVALADETSLAQAARAAVAHRATHIEAIAPYEIELDALPPPHARLRSIAAAALVCGVGGGVGAYLLQWWINVFAYPLDVGGRPLHAAPAFIPLTFESVVLAAGLAVFVAFFIAARMPRLAHPTFAADGIERASADRFFLTAHIDQQRYASLRDVLIRAGALEISSAETSS